MRPVFSTASPRPAWTCRWARSYIPNGFNERGGIEADLTVTRVGEEEFMVVTSAICQTRDLSWFEAPDGVARELALRGHGCHRGHRHAGHHGSEEPGAADRVVWRRLSNQAHPFWLVPRDRNRLCPSPRWSNHLCGELGWELFVSAEHCLDVYDRLIEAGASYGLRPAATMRWLLAASRRLSALEPRHRRRRHAARVRPRLHMRVGQAGRIHRPRVAARGSRPRRPAQAIGASCSRG